MDVLHPLLYRDMAWHSSSFGNQTNEYKNAVEESAGRVQADALSIA